MSSTIESCYLSSLKSKSTGKLSSSYNWVSDIILLDLFLVPTNIFMCVKCLLSCYVGMNQITSYVFFRRFLFLFIFNFFVSSLILSLIKHTPGRWTPKPVQKYSVSEPQSSTSSSHLTNWKDRKIHCQCIMQNAHIFSCIFWCTPLRSAATTMQTSPMIDLPYMCSFL